MLQAKNVELRAIEREELRTVWKWHNDLEVEVPAGGHLRPVSLAQVEAEFDKDLEDDPVTRFGIVVGGTLIGSCVLYDWDDALSLRLGIAIGEKSYWGQGYGRAAVGALLDYAFVHRNAHRVWLEVAADNERAIRAYKSCGFVEEGRLRDNAWEDGHFVDELVMGILRDEWQALREKQGQPPLFNGEAP